MVQQGIFRRGRRCKGRFKGTTPNTSNEPTDYNTRQPQMTNRPTNQQSIPYHFRRSKLSTVSNRKKAVRLKK